MSRLAKKPIQIPEKVSVSFKDGVLEAKGPLGVVKQPINPAINLEIVDGKWIRLTRSGDSKSDRALHGLCVALVKNAIEGVATGFSKELEIRGVGFKAIVEGNKLILSIGFTHPVKIDIPDGIKVITDPKQTLITISGADKYKVGQFAADVRIIRPPEPYKGTGIRYKDERVIKKAGKAAAGAAGGTGAK